MAVISQGDVEIDGHFDTMEAFRRVEAENATGLLKAAMGLKKRDRLPEYNRADHDWPLMVYHAEKGEKVIGVNLANKGREERIQLEKANRQILAELEKQGWRREPYPKPQVTVLDPAVEKAALIAKNDALQGQIIVLSDRLTKAIEAIEKLQKES
jgi:hypothetical protein